jgi:hypothetical protein
VLYVANNWGNSVFVYEPGREQPSRKITAGVDAPIATAVDDAGDLFVGNQARGRFPKGSITIYRPGDVKPIRTITDGIKELVAMAIDAAGDVFAANYRGDEVYEYLAGTTKIAKTIRNGVAGVVALGSSTVTVYAPGSGKVLRTYPAARAYPDALAVGPAR